jgi:transposase
MELLYTHGAGIDVHQNILSVCVLTPGTTATAAPRSEIRQFGTKTADLLALADWLEQLQVTHVAMESTGVYFALSSALIGRVQVPPALR